MRILLSAIVVFSLMLSCSSIQRGVPLSSNYSSPHAKLMETLSKSVCLISYNGSIGSGILYKRDGVVMVLTAAHVIEDHAGVPLNTLPTYGKDPISILGHYPNSEMISYVSVATTVTVNPTLDYAILMLDCEDEDMCFAEFEFNRPQQGEEIFMVGSPAMDVGTISRGIVCHSHRHPKTMWNPPLNEFVQTDAMGGSGSSGGGIFSIASGKCLGVLVLKNGENGLMLSVPIDIIEADLQSSLLKKMTLH